MTHLPHHVGVVASGLAASRAVYVAALAPLGVVVGYEAEGVCELWREGEDTPSLSLEQADHTVTRGVHLAFEARSRGEVDAFHRAAVGAGGTSRHVPAYWAEYGAYCAFVSDPDGNNLEALIKGPPA